MSLRSPRYLLLSRLLLISILGAATHRANAQQTNVTCDKSFDWANNSKDQSPCLVAAYLQGQCYPNKQWNVTSLLPGTQYLAPIGDEATGCACSSPVYSLISACAACQGSSYISWGQWTANCPSARVNNGTFPFQIPADTVVPQWALTVVSPEGYFDVDGAQGGGSGDTGLSGATVFLIVLLPIMLLSLGGFGLWVLWKRKQRHTHSREGSASGREPLMRHDGGSRHTFLSVDTTSDIHIHLHRKSMDSTQGVYGYDKYWAQASPVPRTPESGGYSPRPPSSLPSSISSPGAQYAHYPETPVYHPNQQFLAPPSAGAASTGFAVPHHPPAAVPPPHPSAGLPPLTQPPLTGATTHTFASQQIIPGSNPNRSSYPGPVTPAVVEPENDSGTFPLTPIEPILPTILPLGDPRQLIPPSVRAHAPSTTR